MPRPPTLAPGAITVHVRRRLTATLTATTREQLLTRPGVTTDALDLVEHTQHRRIPYDISEPLDAAWAWFVHHKDTLDPAIQHGATAYRHHCRCRLCSASIVMVKKRDRAGVSPGRLRMSDQLRPHLDQLFAVPGATFTLIGALAGTTRITVRRIYGRGGGRPELVAALLAITEQELVEHLTVVDPNPSKLLLDQLQALGYPSKWVADRVGVEPGLLFRLRSRQCEKLSADVAAKIARVFQEVAGKVATTNDGLEAWVILRSQRMAAAARRFPPAAYDDDGTLDETATQGHPWAVADDNCHARLELVRAIVSTRVPSGKIADQFGISRRNVDRVVSMLRVKRLPSGVYGIYGPAPESAPRVEEILRVLEDYDEGRTSAVLTALRLGVVDLGRLPRSHPDAAAWAAEQAKKADQDQVAA